MIQAIAIDDEVNALGIISTYSKSIADFKLIHIFSDPIKGLEYIQQNTQINCVFLDIQMNKLNGLDLAKKINPTLKVVITTAYPDYALQGFELDVADYLLKPFSFERFNRSIHKIKALINGNNNQQIPKLKLDFQDVIFVRTDYKTQKIRIMDILYIEGSGNYVTIHTTKLKYLVLQNLKSFEEQLTPYQFIRIHKSFIISLSHLDSIEKSYIKIGDQEIPLSESYKDTFNQFLDLNFKQF
ncbi:LytTR family DNA-binding domain-containing protein [Sediminibacterium sp.]|uniref:LytR/AlgR family response regulator transcription factor n=1 Tax=Sediminibacterium sp. TaxID=1917865 RepID=UPI0025DD82CE|nr:LytTR family DNA-binding domain-containing protein [Sediminibacterium sp.]MBT9485241.1 response regulator transcription factor [Sediminibacterium sp.]